MEKLFENLYLYELVLLFLGVLLFTILCAGLVYYIVKKDDVKKLLLFFPIPIIMIGYPSIQEIQIEKDKIALIKYTDEVLDNPENKQAQEELLKVTEKLEKRVNSIKDLKAVSEANLVLGNSDKVIHLTEKAISEEIDEGDSMKDGTADSPSTKVTSEKAVTLQAYRDIRELAVMQKRLQEDSTVAKDSGRINERIAKVSWNNPKTKSYLSKKILKSGTQNR